MAVTEQALSASQAEKGGKLPVALPPTSDSASSVDEFQKQALEEGGHDIKYRCMSWQKTTLLLFGEYVCLAILSLSWSWSVVGWIGGFFITFGLGILTYYTSYTLWQFCMLHPGITDIPELAALLFPRKSKLAYEVVGAMLMVNNIFIVGFHVFTAARIFNTLSDGSICTVWFQLIAALVGIVASLPRTLDHVSTMSVVSALAMGVSIILSLVYAGIEDAPYYGYGGNYPTQGPVATSVTTPPGQTFGGIFNAVLNIAFLWFGQALYPTFIGEMKRPQDFPKALTALTILQLVLFTITAAVGYHFHGQYSTAPFIGSLSQPWARKSAFAFVLVPTIIIGTIYSNVAAKYFFMRVVGRTRHAYSHTVVGWSTWIAIVGGIWLIGFILANVIPSMGTFLSILGAAFSSFFGLIFWSIAYFRMNQTRLFASTRQSLLTVLNIVILLLGLMMLGPGLWTSIEEIIEAYTADDLHVFSCANNSL